MFEKLLEIIKFIKIYIKKLGGQTMAILVTGGTGYIGSHTCVELLERGEKIIVVDNLSNSKVEVADVVKDLTNKDFKFYEADIQDREAMIKIFEENPDIESVIHFAGLKAVGESVEKPLEYYHNNVYGTVVLLEVMKQFGCKKMIFSSSATVYGEPASLPIREDFPLSTTNPYGTTKLMIEMILKDLVIADPTWSIVLLRYFNPIGAHSSGRLGEVPNGIPNNLMPYVTQVAIGQLEELKVFGNDYPTIDGTGVRDYIHVVDLAIGHVKALKKLRGENGTHIYNLGTGNGYSVLQIVETFQRVNGVEVKYKIADRRPGDIPACFADPSKAKEELDWVAERNLEDMCRDAWNFTKNYKF